MANISQLLSLMAILLSSIMINHLPVASSKQWCVSKQTAKDDQLEDNINFACSNGIDCRPILPSGACFKPNTTISHASYLMNDYYQSHGRTNEACLFFFPNSGMLTSTDPSYNQCIYK
ncbi:PREDICTED: major pollen allergen Ole e 10-like [Camelina sativa]|uniref:Major pollen allergen Ole e 10-like n=1 Tax=Camelina sativa TaxID=90675 RepID=A0ABM0Z4V9_CAMSA|nr:PREDICTED: major pollen allergen Ole e 10-like [Camelina sativa]